MALITLVSTYFASETYRGEISEEEEVKSVVARRFEIQRGGRRASPINRESMRRKRL